MKRWWKRQSLKLRLTLWYAAATTVVLAVFAWVTYEEVEHRLADELDRQLRIDFDLMEAQLDVDASGNIEWSVQGAHGSDGFAPLSAWFEIWSEDGELLFRHWPVPEGDIENPLPAPAGASLRFQTVHLEPGLYVRTMERPALVGDRGVVARVFRSEAGVRHALEEIVEVFVLAAPLGVALASLGGYLMARRSLRPVAAMASQAQRVTSESLGERLPNPNPHDELGQLATVFNDTLHRLENSFAELKRFIADASHELRTPLTALRAVGEVALRQPGDGDDLREVIGSMLEEAQRLQDLVESLLELTRLESGKVTVRREPVPVLELVEEVRESLAELCAEKRQVVELVGDGSVTALADRLLLRQVLMNVIHNAARYSPAGSRIRGRVSRCGSEALIEISDQGPGIDAEHLSKIFERFYRVDKARSPAERGYGLGLSIAKWSVERMGGYIEVESAKGDGSLFRIALPADIQRQA